MHLSSLLNLGEVRFEELLNVEVSELVLSTELDELGELSIKVGRGYTCLQHEIRQRETPGCEQQHQ
jgi:hypothetical protein